MRTQYSNRRFHCDPPLTPKPALTPSQTLAAIVVAVLLVAMAIPIVPCPGAEPPSKNGPPGNSGPLDEAGPVDFNKVVRPILAANCFACHGPDEGSREADLRLDDRDSAIAARDGKPAIIPGQSSQSELARRIGSMDPDLLMPPPDSGHQLSAGEVRLLVRWIDQGAKYDRHWSFVNPVRPPLPRVSAADWPRSPLDRFILARLEQAGLKPAAEADRYALIRRLSLDLTGVPPTPDEVDRFVRDTSPAAYEALVDRLLASPRFGEHWARMWLDLARYADTKGYEKDQPREIWRYRDWVIDALNQDRPFDQFTTEQLAGDLLPDADSDQLLATAFHRNTMTNDEGGTDNEEFRVVAVKDRVDTTVQVWMGLTMGCANCHSHKYDPITQREYYQFLAYFNQTEDADRSDDAPRAPTPDRLRSGTTAPTEKEELDKQIPQTPVMRELPVDRRRATHVHERGNFLQPGEAVEPAMPAAFNALPESAPANRLAVAQWLLASDNPLTARVAVNRIWARLFGVGLVETEEDFGRQGAPPSHPELLDWLALDFRESQQWSLKGLCRRIVLSATYRQDSRRVLAAEQLAKGGSSSARDGSDQGNEVALGNEPDPGNRLLARGSRFRLPAEVVRDQALAASGLLSLRIGGPSVMPPQPPGIWRTTYSQLQWKASESEDRYRRGLYTFWRRTSPYPSMLTFDAGSREVCVIRRVRTNTPLQALVTMNDPVYVEAAGELAVSVLKEDRSDPASRAAAAFRRILVRPPSDAEVTRILALLDKAHSEFQQDPQAASELLETSRVQPPEGVDPPTLAAWILVANTLLNLDETLMRN